jgi:hypothetical protein
VSGTVLNVSCRGSPPVAGMTKTSLLPKRSLVNATSRPSGERRGNTSRAMCAVNRAGFVPSSLAIQMSP